MSLRSFKAITNDIGPLSKQTNRETNEHILFFRQMFFRLNYGTVVTKTKVKNHTSYPCIGVIYFFLNTLVPYFLPSDRTNLSEKEKKTN